ncbi:MAG: ATP-grasp domain-containing protein [Candidatus Babeliaceae bacterium]|nr:ATP-grasp domain-containing protein [Candidatus Babeliaceae bacterium]
MSLLRVGVFMGGRSAEREVSLNSGRTVCDHLDAARYAVFPVYQTSSGTLYVLPWRFLHRGKSSDFETRLSCEAERVGWSELKDRIDFAFIALHGRYGEDGIIQGVFELLGIPYLGSKVLASALGMNKAIQKTFLRAANIAVPRDIVVSPGELLSENDVVQRLRERLLCAGLTFPLVVKPSGEGSSIGVMKVFSEEQLRCAVERAMVVSERRQPVLIEEMVEGMEFSCIVITDRDGNFLPLPPTEIELENGAHIFDYEQKYMPGRATKHTPARCSSETITAIQKTAVCAMRALGFTNLGRIDGFVQKDGTVVVTDPNSFSGMAPSSYAFLQAAELGMMHTDLINHLIETELRAYGVDDSEDAINDKKGDGFMHDEGRVRVGVLLGGASNEREISLESGRNICYKLSPAKYEVTPLFVRDDLTLYMISQRLLVRNTTHEIVDGLESAMAITWDSVPERFDFIFIGLHGGVGENGTIQGMLEMLNVPYNGSSVLQGALCMNKFETNKFLRAEGFDVPSGVFISREEWREHCASTLPFSFPVIVKPNDDGCSMLVQKADSPQACEQAAVRVLAQKGTGVLIEECLTGVEVTVGVLGNDQPFALPPSQSIARGAVLSIEEKFLPGAGENLTPARLPATALAFIRRRVEQIYRAVGCKGYARVDCFYQDAAISPTGTERLVVLEINTLPALTPATCIFHQAAEMGMRPMDFIDLIVRLGFEEHTQKPHLSPVQRSLFKQTHVCELC